MSELAYHIKQLRKTKGPVNASSIPGISRETIYRVERGGKGKLSTVRKIARTLRASDQEWISILIAWLKLQVGKDIVKLRIEALDAGISADPLTEGFNESFRRLTYTERQQILSVMERKEILACLPALNRIGQNKAT